MKGIPWHLFVAEIETKRSSSASESNERRLRKRAHNRFRSLSFQLEKFHNSRAQNQMESIDQSLERCKFTFYDIEHKIVSRFHFEN